MVILHNKWRKKSGETGKLRFTWKTAVKMEMFDIKLCSSFYKSDIVAYNEDILG